MKRFKLDFIWLLIITIGIVYLMGRGGWTNKINHAALAISFGNDRSVNTPSASTPRIKNMHSIEALGVGDQRRWIWTTSGPSRIKHFLQLTNQGAVLFWTDNGRVYLVDAVRGTPLWITKLSSALEAVRLEGQDIRVQFSQIQGQRSPDLLLDVSTGIVKPDIGM